MRHNQSKIWIPTLREVPAESDTLSHRYMLRAGLVRQLAAGIYTYLPLGKRILHKVESIIREEMEKAGAQEVHMPVLQPAELWRETGRYDQYGPELMRLKDRHDREFALGPTHEEVVTALMRNEIGSYRQLPMIVYQIGIKVRDEKRPRYGLLRGREFLMKDAYSFSADAAGLDASYLGMYRAYTGIFDRIDLRYCAVEADGGAIGDAGGTHEFMALSQIGEDTIAVCNRCDYAANLEKAATVPNKVGSGPAVSSSHDEATPATQSLAKIYTPQVKTIAELSAFLHIPAKSIVKTLIYCADGHPIAVLVRGDHEVNEVKLKNKLGATSLELADSDRARETANASIGFAGPVGLTVPIYADYAIMELEAGVIGANEQDYHYVGYRPSVDLLNGDIGDYRNATEGDQCPDCGNGTLALRRGIEVGHVFKLGTKYSEAMGALCLNPLGERQPLVMGCYGIGVSRLLTALIEQHADEKGMLWPKEIAPYDVHIIPVSIKDETQVKLAESLAQSLSDCGIVNLFDDRDERAGVKFNDADLIGIPFRIVVGRRASEGIVELKQGREPAFSVSTEDALAAIKRER